MTTLNEVRQQYPDLAGLDDDQVVDALHTAFYADMPRETVAQRLGVKPVAPKAPPSSTFRRVVGDTAVSLGRGIVGVPEAVVGLADIPTGGRVGKAVEDAGVRFKEAKDIMGEWYSPEQKTANAAVQNAKGFVDTFGKVIEYPSTAWHSVVESAPSMFGGGAAAQTVRRVAPSIGPVLAGAMGEGAVTAGSQAESIRQETADGLLTPEQSAIAGTSGALTSVLGVLGGKVAKSLGIKDVDSLLAGQAAEKETKGFIRRLLEGALTEGVIEELPQSVQEQMAQNIALGKPLDEGVPQAAVLGTLAGSAMGAGGQLFSGSKKAEPATPGDAIRAQMQPETGPMTRAANAGLEFNAEVADKMLADARATKELSIEPPAPPADGIPFEADPRFANAPTFDNGRAPQAQIFGSQQAADIAIGEQGLMGSHEAVPTQGGFQIRPVGTAGVRMVSPGVYQTRPGSEPPAPEPVQRPDPATLEPPAAIGETPARLDAAPVQPVAPPLQESAPPLQPDAGVQAVAPPEKMGPFDSPEAADSYISQQRRSGGSSMPRALPRRFADGSYGVATEGTEEFTQAQAEAKQRADVVAGIKPGDQLNKLGEPFKNKAAAVRVKNQAGGNVVEVKGGWVVRPEPEAKKLLTGEAIDKEWTAFSPESGTKGVPRADMPQVLAEHRGALVNFLNARGVTHESDIEVPADQLKPTQAEFSPVKVAKAREFKGGDRSILVSADGHVVDGHHQWVAKLDKGEPVKAIRINAPIEQLLPLVREFPSAQASAGATQPNTPPPSAGDSSTVPNTATGEKAEPGKLETPQPNLAQQWAEAVRRGDTEGARALNDQIVAEKKAKKAAAAEPAPAPAPAPQEAAAVADETDEMGARWTRSTEADRIGLLVAAGWKAPGGKPSPNAQILARQSWDKIKPAQRERIAAGRTEEIAAAEAAPAPAPAPAADDGQKDELDAEMRSYERKAEAAAAAPRAKAPKPGRRVYNADGSYYNEPADAPAKPAPSKNTLFTEDAANAARALLKSKLGQLNSGFDPELMQAGLTLAGYHIERGARTFAAYAKAMVEDLGDGIRPFLKSFYMAVKYDPRGVSLDGMSSAAEVEAADITALSEVEPEAPSADTVAKEPDDAARPLDSPSPAALEGVPAGEVQAPAGGGDAGSGAEAGGPGDGGRNGDAAQAGGDGAGGLGNGAGAAPVPARGSRQPRADGAKPRVRRAAGRESEPGLFDDAGRAGDVNPAPNAAPIPAPAFKPADFTITDELALGEGGQKTKFRANLDAIKLLKQLETEQRPATPDEQKVLARYVGWGGLAQAFDGQNDNWTKEHAELKDLLTPDEYSDARQSTQYAHYTSREIIGGIYDALAHLGFTGGRVIEPGSGVGNFMGLMPAALKSSSRFTAIEREPIAAGIARHLYPMQNVQEADYTEFQGKDDYFDAAIGNPPFAATTLTDASGRKHLTGLSVHNYFFAKSVDQLREGGILAMVVSNSFLDAQRDTARKYIAERTKLLGAIRLPNNAFSKNANTEVTTDIVFLQKRPEAEWGNKATMEDAKRWLDLENVPDPRGGAPIPVNRYFSDNPQMMLGEMGRYGTMYRPDTPALVAKAGQDTGALLREAVNKLPEGVYVPPAVAGTQRLTEATVVALKDSTVQEGGHYVRDGKLYQRLPDVAGEARAIELTPATMWTEKTTLGETGVARLVALSEIRSTLRGLLAAELNGDANMEALRATLNQQYDAYAKDHGLLNDPSTTRVFDDDPDFPLLASLEHDYVPGIGPAAAKRQGVKPQKSTAKKAPIFRQRVVEQRKPVRRVATPADALAVSMAERGRIDSAYIAELLGKDAKEVLEDLSSGTKPLLFLDPATDEYVLRDAYLSGNVRAKLHQARQAGRFSNARALEEVQPEDVGPGEITARIGSPWVPESVYQDFARELFGEATKASIQYVKINSSYMGSIYPANETASATTWGTKDYRGDALLLALMNNREIKVTWRDSEGKVHVDKEATENANVKAQEIRDRFNDWLFADGDRSELLVRAYNDTNNNYVTRSYDGSFMHFPGKVPDSIIKFRRHQRNAIARIVQDRTALLDHVVGAGKTYTVVSAAMELKRTGLANKPMIAVPNHLVKQWASDFYRLYPGANILTATKKDFSKANRRKFLAKIATGDWDAVVIAHSSFGFIKPAPDFEAAFNERQVQNIVNTIKAVENLGGDDRAKKRTVKQLEGLKERLENRIKSLRQKPMDALLDFEQIGVDQLFVDEAHLFKNLMFSTKMQNIRGLGDSKGSQRAYDMFVKVAQVYTKNGRGQGVVFATGTPVSNSLAEMYHMMRYLMPDQLEAMGFTSFDAWANTFASVNQEWDQKSSGDGFKAINTMSSFVNTHELLRVFDQVADTVTMEDIKAAFREENDGKEFPLPALKTGRRQPVSLVKSEAQNEYMKSIAARAAVLEQRKGPPGKGEDNALVLMTDARKAAMDIRLVDPTITEREKGGRIDTAAGHIFDRWKQWNHVRGTQLVFSDLGTPIKTVKKELAEYQELKARADVGLDEAVTSSAMLGDEAAIAKLEDAEEAQAELDKKGSDWLTAIQAALRGFSIYDDLKAALIERGVPAEEIAFIHDFNTDEQKAGLFRKVNSGQIRVLLGSTAKMGAGTNVQERVTAEHHLDVPWKPSDIEQREGRVLRQGNRLHTEVPGFEVEILAYVTQDTLDMKMWMIQERKLKMINQLRTRKVDREIENSFEDMEMSAGEMQAAATGNMDLLKEIQLRTDVKKLEQRKRSFDAQRNDLESRRRRATAAMGDLPQKIEALKPWVAAGQQWQEAMQQERKLDLTVDGKAYTSRGEAADALRAIVDAHDAKLQARDEAIAADPNAKPSDFPMPKLAVEFNGKTYGSKAAVADAFTDAVGDASRLDWQLNGETFVRRSKLAAALAQDVADALATDTERAIGSFGPFKVTVEGQTARLGDKLLDVVVELDGKTTSSDIVVPKEAKGNVAERMAAQAITMAERLATKAKSELEYAEWSMVGAKRQLAELDKTELPAAWPDADKLEKARTDHREILARLSAVKKPEAQPAEGETPAFSRARPGDSTRVASVRSLVETITERWANPPPVVVVPTFNHPDVPADMKQLNEQQLAQGAGGVPAAFYRHGKVYIVADQMGGDAEVVRVLFHESLGHFGLRAAFGRELGAVLDSLAVLNAGKVREKAKQYGLDYDKMSERRLAAEEVLAEMAEKSPEVGWVKRAIAAIRTWLRANVPGFGKMKFSDAEIIANFLTPARRYVQQQGARVSPEFADTVTGDAAGMFSRTQEAARNLFLDATTSHGSVNFWQKTVGTQYHKAQQNPQTFGRVFNAVQDYIKDISVYANAAGDQAPNLIPRLDGWRDLKKAPPAKADLAAAGRAIFEGTLNDKQRYTRAELRSKFNLTDAQIGLYREFRAAVDQSLDDMAKAELVRLANAQGTKVAGAVMAAPLDQAADMLANFMEESGDTGMADLIREKAEKVDKLKEEGYAPLMRFGKHTLHVTRGGETVYFGMYESQMEANRAARLLREDGQFQGADFAHGLMSQEQHKLFAGLPLDSLELFASITGNEDNAVYQDYLKLTKSNRSALKRMIHRQGIAGYSEDVTRVLASFLTSNARLAAANLHLGAAKEAAQAIPKEQGDLKDEAVRLVDYVQNPQEEAAALRGLLFTSFIGGSVASAAVNLTQPITMTMPYLSQYGGMVKASARILAAAKVAASGKAEGELAAALKRAEDDGIVSPQEIHHLQAEAMNRLGNHPYLKKAAFIWGSMFSLSEQFNRRVSFIAAYQTAVAEQIANPAAFAERAVIETQGLYNKGNKANWARGAFGATVMTFKQFSTHYLEFLTRMYQSGPEGKRAVAVALAVLLLVGGAGGLPFAEDLDDLIDTMAQALGYDFNSKKAKRQFIADTLGLGNAAAEVATRGLSAIPGMPFDVSLRMGMGNLLPGTGVLLRSNTDRSRDVLEVFGAAGGLAKNAMDGAQKALRGDVLEGAGAVVPVALQNLVKAVQMGQTGQYRNTKGQKVTDVDMVDAAMKGIGFQPAEVARESARMGEVQRSVQLVKNVESDIAGKWAQAMADGKPEGVRAARQELADWNAKNPGSRISISPAQILRRVRDMRASRADRAVKSAPKEMRSEVREALS